jgi:hypothetical protein
MSRLENTQTGKHAVSSGPWASGVRICPCPGFYPNCEPVRPPRSVDMWLRARAALKTSCRLRCQTAHLGSRPPSPNKSFAQRVTRKNNAGGTGVMRAMVLTDHWSRVSPPRWRRTSFDRPAPAEPALDVQSAGLETGAHGRPAGHARRRRGAPTPSGPARAGQDGAIPRCRSEYPDPILPHHTTGWP